jgi:hypothetical protein
LGGFYERRYAPKGLTVLVVSIPGVPPLTIGCIEPSQKLLPMNAWRFSWLGRVPHEKDPAYLVSGAGWVTLVDTFGLTPRLLGGQPMPAGRSPGPASAPAPPLYSKPRYAKAFHRLAIGYLAFCLLFMVALLVVAAVLHQW